MDATEENSRAPLAILAVGFRPEVQEQLCRVSVPQSHGVEERRTAVAVDDVHLGTTKRHQRLYAVRVASAGCAMQSCTDTSLLVS